jgi:hypothetical protein
MNCARTLLVAFRIQAWIVVDTIGEVISEVEIPLAAYPKLKPKW